MTKAATRERRLFAEILIREGIASPDTVKRALQVQMQTGEPIEEVLVEEGVITEWDLARTLVKHYKLPFMPLHRYSIPKQVLETMPAEFLREHAMIPLDRFGSTLTIAIARNPEPGLKEQIHEDFGVHASYFVTTLTDVKNAINLHFPTPFSEFDGLLTDVKKSFKDLGGWEIESGEEPAESRPAADTGS